MSNPNHILATRNADLDALILEGKALDAFETYYADDVVMIEADGSRREGKDANREHELAFFGSIAEFHGARLLDSAVSGDTSYSEWIFDFTPTGGARMQMKQVATRTWRDGQVVEERFYAGN